MGRGGCKLRSSHNVVSAFTKGLTKQTLNIMSQQLKMILTLLHDILNHSNFSSAVSYAMGLLLSPVIADTCTKAFDLKAFHNFLFH